MGCLGETFFPFHDNYGVETRCLRLKLSREELHSRSTYTASPEKIFLLKFGFRSYLDVTVLVYD